MRRNQIASKLLQRCEFNANSLLYDILQDKVQKRLTSRTPIWSFLEKIRNFNILIEWKVAWNDIQLLNYEFIQDPTKQVEGFQLARNIWVTLNRIRVNHGRCNSSLFKWGTIDSASCDCGELTQTIPHIINFCPLRRFIGSYTEFFQLSEQAIKYIQDLDINL